jgi:ribokinase
VTKQEVPVRPSITVVGSTMVDMITYVSRAPIAGETVVGDRFVQGFGGKGANQAVMASRMGADVRMVNCVGDDVFGDMTIENLKREAVSVEHITRAVGVSSGVAPIWVEHGGTNRIICVPGANDHMTCEQAVAAVESAAELHLALGQFEVPQPVTAAAFAAAHERGAVTVLNPAPAAELSEELRSVTDWLVPNEVEFAHLAEACGIQAADITDEAIAGIARATGVKLVVTLGDQGVALCSDGESVLRLPAPSVQAVDTTGAGDAFVGAFAYGLAQGMPVQDAAVLGCACAAASVTREGTQSSFSSPTELAELIQKVRSTTEPH